MSKIVLDADWVAKLNGGTEPVAFTDEAGNVVGHYFSREAFTRIMEFLTPPPLTNEEIAEARKEMLEKGGLSTDDVIAEIRRAKRVWKGE